MSDADQLAGAAQTITQLFKGRSAYVEGSLLNWTLAKPGIFIKTLYADPHGSERTLLFRLEPGARSAPHSHQEFEQIYVLEGAFHDGDRWLRAGDHCVRPVGVEHSAWSAEGALALVTYSTDRTDPQ